MIDLNLAQQRAISLATVLLTRDPRVQEVNQASFKAGYDLEVRIGRADALSARIFAVELKARASVHRLGRFTDRKLWLSKDLKTGMYAMRNTLADVSYPLLFIAFAMDSDRAFYTWLREPSISSKKQRQLKSPLIETANEWDTSTHVRIIDSVDRWYDIARVNYFRDND